MADRAAATTWRSHPGGARIARLAIGAFPVIGSGVLGGRTAVTHWAAVDALAALHPSVEVHRAALWPAGPARLSCMTAHGDDPATTLFAKLGIAEGTRVALLHAPSTFGAAIGDLPDAATVQHGLSRADRVDVILAFVTERAHLARNIGWLVTTLNPGGAFWVAWPRPQSGVATDLTDAVIRDVAATAGWGGTTVCAIGDTWSALQLRARDGDRPDA